MNGPGLIESSFKLDNSAQPRKRRFKIFDNKLPPEPLPIPIVVEAPQQKRELALTKAVEMVKIEPKIVLQREFYGGAEEEEELCLLEVRMDEYETVRSDKFFATDCFRQLPTPSMLIKENRIVINEAGALYQSVQEVRHSHGGLQAAFQDLSSSMSLMEGYILQKEEAARQTKGRLQQFKCVLQGIWLEQAAWEGRLAKIDRRIATLEQSQNQQLRVFDEEEGQRVEVEEQDMCMRVGQEEDEEDELVETHYLQAQIIFKMMEQRRSQQKIEADAQAQRKVKAEKAQLQTKQALKLFHSIFRIGDYEYQRLLAFLDEEFPKHEGKMGMQLIFRRGTTDLDAQAVGQKEELQYKGNLLFLIKTSTGRRIGGFISSCLLQGQSMEDEHAFLLTLEEGCHKLPVKAQCANQAFSCSRHYLVAFSNDLMISANCLQEENYCEWPSSYASQQQKTNKWFAGDFEFMIQHIEIFEVQLS